MTPIFTLLCVTFAITALSTAAAMPVWRRLCHASGLMDAPGRRKIHDAPVPLSGGLALFTGLAVVAAFWWIPATSGMLPFSGELSGAFHRHAPRFTAIALGLVAMFILGLVDDRFELRPGAKFLGQLLVAVGATLGGVRCGFPGEHPVLQIALTVLWILAVTNAFNFIDNMNGLCGGLCLVTAISTAALASRNGELFPATIAAAIAGAALGFLPFNYPKASAFLGDSGSHLIGFTLAVLVIEPGLRENPTVPLSIVSGPALLLAVPLLDLCWVVGLRTWMRKPFYLGDTNHLSHQLVRLGLPRAVAVAVLWGFAAAGGAAALLLL